MTEKPLSEKTFITESRAIWASGNEVVAWSDVELAVARLREEYNFFLSSEQFDQLLDKIFGVVHK